MLITQNIDRNKKSKSQAAAINALGSATAAGNTDAAENATKELARAKAMPADIPDPFETARAALGQPAVPQSDAGLPSYAKGVKRVPRTGAAILHKGEEVVPAKEVNPFNDRNLHDQRHPNNATFSGARPSARHSYLELVDPDYKKASPDLQKRYRDHLAGDQREPGLGKIAMPQQKGFGSAMPTRTLSSLTERVLSSLGLSENAKKKIRQSGLDDQAIQQMVSKFSRQQLEALAK